MARMTAATLATQAARGYVPVAEVARRLGGGVHRATVMRWIVSGRVQAQRVCGTWYVDTASVPELAAQTTAPADVPQDAP